MQKRTILTTVVSIIAASGALTYGDVTIGSLSTDDSLNSGGQAYLGETFTVPAGETGIPSVSTILQNATATAGASIQIYNWSPATQSFVGQPIYSVPISVPNGTLQVFSASPNLTVTPGQSLALVVRWDGSGGQRGSYFFGSSYYSGGHAIFEGNGQTVSFPDYDMPFLVQFGAIVPEPTTAMILLPTMVGLLRRRR